MKQLSPREFGNRLIERFPRLIKEILKYESYYLTKGVISIPMLGVLDLLDLEERSMMTNIASNTGLKFSSATALVDRMVKENLVQRNHGENDRRTVYVFMTKKGKRIYTQIYRDKRKGIIQLFSSLTAEERASYLAMIDKVLKNTDKRAGGKKNE